MLNVGDTAPDFDLPGVDGRTGEAGRWSLSQFRGRQVVLAFYPGDNSPVCTEQLREYTAGIAELDRLGAQVLAISPQSTESHRDFAASQGGFAFPLLADEGKAVGEQYGILGLLGLYRRSIFVVDGEGRVSYTHRVIGPGLRYRSLEDVVVAVGN